MALNHKGGCACIICISGLAAKARTRKNRNRTDTLASWRESVEIARNVLRVTLYAAPTILIIAGMLKALLFILSI